MITHNFLLLNRTFSILVVSLTDITLYVSPRR